MLTGVLCNLYRCQVPSSNAASTFSPSSPFLSLQQQCPHVGAQEAFYYLPTYYTSPQIFFCGTYIFPCFLPPEAFEELHTNERKGLFEREKKNPTLLNLICNTLRRRSRRFRLGRKSHAGRTNKSCCRKGDVPRFDHFFCCWLLPPSYSLFPSSSSSDLV